MAAQFQVYGPTTLTWGGTALGQSDGNALITIREVAAHRPVTTDAYGGQPADWIQLARHAIVLVTLVHWDQAVLDKIVTAFAVGSSAGEPNNTPGNTGEIGGLRIGNTGYGTLVVAGSKSQSRQGGYSYSFPRAFRDPEADAAIDRIGVDASRYTIPFRCQIDGSGVFYTRTAVT